MTSAVDPTTMDTNDTNALTWEQYDDDNDHPAWTATGLDGTGYRVERWLDRPEDEHYFLFVNGNNYGREYNDEGLREKAESHARGEWK